MHSSVIERAPSMGREASGTMRAFASVSARIAEHARNNPGQFAVIDGSARITYSQLEDQSNKLAAYFREAGVGTDGCIGLFLERSSDFVIAALAAMKAGAAYLPLDPSTPLDRMKFILSDAGAPLLVTHRNKARGLTLDMSRLIELDGPEAGRIAVLPGTATEDVSPERLAYVIYTSGSTGRPKGVEITHANLQNLIDWHIEAFAVTADDKASQVAGLGFDAAAWEIWPHLAAGATLHIADDLTRRSPQTLRDWIVAEKITIAFVPTVLAEQLLHSSWPGSTALRTLLTGADTLHRRPAANLPFILVNNYGPTECTVVATSGTVSPNGAIDGAPSIGKAISNTTVLILDEAMHPVPVGQAGELCLAGTLVARGYRNNPELTASRFVTYHGNGGAATRVYKTGDRAKFLENGEIAFLGRLDDQVKIRGYRIELGEIISSLDRYPGIEASAVVVRESPEGPALIAYVVSANVTLLASDIREFLGRRLPDYMVPAQFVKVTSLPITANGKLDKASLPTPDAENLIPHSVPPAAGPASNTAVSSTLEQRVAELVASLLGQPSVRREDNFFMLGGHSMLGAQLVARIRETFAVKLTLRQLFGAPTVAALSAEVTRLTDAAAKSGAS